MFYFVGVMDNSNQNLGRILDLLDRLPQSPGEEFLLSDEELRLLSFTPAAQNSLTCRLSGSMTGNRLTLRSYDGDRITFSGQYNIDGDFGFKILENRQDTSFDFYIIDGPPKAIFTPLLPWSGKGNGARSPILAIYYPVVR